MASTGSSGSTKHVIGNIGASEIGMRKIKLAMSHTYNALTDERYRRFFYQRSVLNLEARRNLVGRVARGLPGPLPQSSGSERDIETLRSDGYVMTTGAIPQSWIDDLRAHFTGRPVKDGYRPELPAFRPPHEAPPGTHVAYYTNEEVAAAPHALAIANHPKILSLVAAEMGVKPIVGYMLCWWSLPAGDGKAQHAENYHRDVDDYDWTKLFIYLTDVDDTAGPHAFVKGSHRIEKLMPIRRYQDQEVYDSFGKDQEVRFTGPAGTMFLEKTFGLHRGFPVSKTPRLAFQVTYSMKPMIYGPKKPVAALPAGLDPYVNQVYCR